MNQTKENTLRNIDLLRNPFFNRGTAFAHDERQALGLRGLLPPGISTIDTQAARIMENFAKLSNDLEKYSYLINLEDRNETLFYRVVVDNLETMLPIIYTPTVGQACQAFGHIFRKPRGLYVSIEDKGHVDELVQNWPLDDVKVIVVSDGERILGLGDLGTNGMGIPVGKSALYTAIGGIHPAATMPILLDVGTENMTLRNDPLYLGLRQPRVRGELYDELVAELFAAVTARWPGVLVQFEDFGNQNAFRLLADYRNDYCTFNDDMQGTAAVTLAGILSATRLTHTPLSAQTFLFMGAGEAGTGIADLIVSALRAEGVTESEARQRCWFVDSKGLVVASRTHLAEHKRPYAHDAQAVSTFLEAVEQIRPTAIIGVSGQPRLFTQPVIEKMAQLNKRPIIFALSNPTTNSECTASEAYQWSEGRAIFASGSPFTAVDYQGQTFVPGQGNNAYIFPGVGLGVVTTGAQHVTDEMFMAAARRLAELTTEEDLQLGRVYPPLSQIRSISAEIAAAVAQTAVAQNLATTPTADMSPAAIAAHMYEPSYRPLPLGVAMLAGEAG